MHPEYQSPPEGPEESEAFLADVAAAMAAEFTGAAGENSSGREHEDSRRALEGAAPWLAIAEGQVGWRQLEPGRIAYRRRQGDCLPPHCRICCLGCKRRLRGNPVPEPAQGFLHPPGDQITIWSRFENYCRVCFDLRLREWALYEDRVDLIPIPEIKNSIGYPE